MKVKDAITFLDSLKPFLSNFQQEKRWILEFIFNKNYLIKLEKILTQDEEKLLKDIVEKRSKNYPLQYLLGTVEFYGEVFNVMPGVLIPREDTACLVEYAIQNTPLNSNVLEIGIGTGIISIILQKYRTDLNIQGIDINPLAIECSKQNANIILGEKKPEFLISNLFQNVTEKFDLIISNPPYITGEERENSDPELLYEPIEALVTQKDGLEIYERIALEGYSYLKKEGKLILEISFLRLEKIKELFCDNGYSFQTILIDFLGRKRALVFNKIH